MNALAPHQWRQRGMTLVELLIAVAIAGFIMAALAGLTQQSARIQAAAQARAALAEDARFAMQRMVDAVRQTDRLLLPLLDNPGTTWREDVREQTVPNSLPEPGSLAQSAVLAVTLDPSVDLDHDGVPDADNDGDGQFDEDPYGDLTRDTASGIWLIDDDEDGWVDEQPGGQWWNDDEHNFGDEDPVNGIDDEGDGNIDEDPFSDINGDGAPGVVGVDDDGDGSTDEGNATDDDEDGADDEDSLEPVVFYLNGDALVERMPVPWDESGNSIISGRDFVESTLAEDVTRFRVERLPPNGQGITIINLTLELTGDTGATVAVNTQVRMGSGR